MLKKVGWGHCLCYRLGLAGEGTKPQLCPSMALNPIAPLASPSLQVAPTACPAPCTPTRRVALASARHGEQLFCASACAVQLSLHKPGQHQPLAGKLRLPPTFSHTPLPQLPTHGSPANTYAWLPGSTECVRCAAGVATAHTDDQEAGELCCRG